MPTAASSPAVWDQPYLETCCRSALHRVLLTGGVGRPPGLKDGPCLQRMARMGLVCARADGRYEVTEAGRDTYKITVLGETA